ncbi:RNA ligase family protein [Bacillus sp. AG4(2022)]|uniref:ATP-dependent DNA ligase n=1 Tax=Bacillus sp. AG4(2022) TaxID=2962594 RepID=UPI002880DCC4|nr:RNA ligase family protein [Bacillus sp. AG4(2022)]MDT0160390.1 RNA ligase family protein [Bacillus sp. AG4(2022)]
MFVSPMLLHKSDHPFEDDSYITELKLDGIRMILSKINNKVKIYSRHNNDITSRFPELLDLPVPDGTILDGELIVTDQDGKPDFEAMMEKFQSKKSIHEVSYSVFDVIQFKNKSVTHLPLLERKALLEEIIPKDTGQFNKVKWLEGNAEAYFELVKQHGLEGIVQKRSNSTYQVNKRSHDWLKVINYQYETVYITGLRKAEFGLLMQFEDGRYAGVLEFVKPAARKEFYQQYKTYVTEENEKYVYLDPKLKCKVKYRNLTKKGLLRIPSFMEWAN